MKSFIHNVFTFIVALIGAIGGLLWCFKTNWDYEPLILLLVSVTEIVSFFLVPKENSNDNSLNSSHIINSVTAISSDSVLNVTANNNSNNFDIQINNNINEKIGHSNKKSQMSLEDNNFAIDSKKNKISILFIDDDKNFNIVKILKDSGWKNTKTVVDVKTIDDQNIKNSEIIFVDINGVGKLLNLPNEGLDLALMIKQKYNDKKKVIIYSANNMNDAFHEAWSLADSRLVKNALPYQFQHLVEKFSLEFYNS